MIETAYKVTVFGKVQGVYFRASTKQKADELGILGSVKNLPNGSVEIVMQGNHVRIQDMLTWCESGPPRAVVETIEIEKIEPEDFTNFEIIRL